MRRLGIFVAAALLCGPAVLSAQGRGNGRDRDKVQARAPENAEIRVITRKRNESFESGLGIPKISVAFRRVWRKRNSCRPASNGSWLGTAPYLLDWRKRLSPCRRSWKYVCHGCPMVADGFLLETI